MVWRGEEGKKFFHLGLGREQRDDYGDPVVPDALPGGGQGEWGRVPTGGTLESVQDDEAARGHPAVDEQGTTSVVSAPGDEAALGCCNIENCLRDSLKHVIFLW